MAKTLANYDPLVQIPSGMTPAGADFPIVESHDILVGENDKRLDAKLDDIDSAIGNVGQTPIATQLSSKVDTGDIVTSVAATGSTSNNKIPSETAVRAAIEAKTINVDSTVTEGSANAVSGGAVHTQLATKQDTLTFDTTPTASSNNPVTSGGVKTALDAKQDTLTFDTTPTASSSNPVTSGGVKAALDTKQNTLTYETTPIVGSVNPVTSTGIRNAIDTAAAQNLGAMQAAYDTFSANISARVSSLSNGMVACSDISAETTVGDTRILLYTGTTNANYTNGHWYYNSAPSNAAPSWTDGGAVGSAPTIDNTLTTAGAAADSKSVGDAIENIVTISNTQPGANSGNKVWIKETTDEEVQIPTYEEHISKANKADITTNNESDNGSGTITASKAYAIGDHFYINNTNTSSENYGVSTLYKATAAIASGSAIVVGTNCEASKVVDELTSLSNDLATTNNNLNVTNTQFLSLTGAVIPPQFAVGSRYVQNGVDKWATNSTRLSIAQGVYISLKAGDVVTKDATVSTFSGGYSTDGGSTFTSIPNGYGPYTAPADGLYFFNLVKANSGTWTDAEALEGWMHIKFTRVGSVIDVLTASVNSVVSATDDVKTSIGYEYTQIHPTSYYTLEYTGKGLNYLGQVVDDPNQDTSDYIELTDDFYDICRVVQDKQVWGLGKLCYYTANKIFIDDIALGTEYDFSIYNGETVVWIGVDKTLFENAKYIRYCGDNRRGFKYWLVCKGGKASVLDDYAHLRFGGKKIVNFGDSIFGNRRPPKDISSYLANLTGATVYNCGFGGCEMSVHSNANYTPFSMCSLADSIASVKAGSENPWTTQETNAALSGMPAYFSETVALLKTINWDDVDIITIAYGSNDFNNGSPLDNGGNSDTAYFADALRYSIETILTAYPQIKIFVCSIAYRAWLNASYEFIDDTNTHTVGGNTVSAFNDKLREVSEEYCLTYIDDYNIGINRYNRLYYFPTTDGAHHNQEGTRLIAENIANKLF